MLMNRSYAACTSVIMGMAARACSCQLTRIILVKLPASRLHQHNAGQASAEQIASMLAEWQTGH